MKIGLYSISYLGIWYDGPALSLEDMVKRARDFGYDGIELDGKRPHGNPLDWSPRRRDQFRNLLETEGMELPCLAANNDFSSPVPELREAQLMMVREQARLAADLGAPIVRLFAAWHGVTNQHNGLSTYDQVRGDFYTFERQYPFATRIERWNYVKECLKEAAAFGEEFGVTMALQNHFPLIKTWKDVYDLVQEVNSPYLKVCLDLPMMIRQDKEWVTRAAKTIGDLQVHSHFGGEFYRDRDGRVQLKELDIQKPLPDYATFLKLMKEIGYDGYFTYELCHLVLNERHEVMGLDYVNEQVELAQEFMDTHMREAGVRTERTELAAA